MKNPLIFKADGVIITTGSNLFYFSGYQNDDAIIILTNNNKYYISDSRVIEEANQKLTDFVILEVIQNDYKKAIKEVIKRENIKKLGYEDQEIKLAKFNELLDLKLELIPYSSEISYIRAKKSATEIELIKKAQAITDASFTEILKYFKEGITELEIKAILESDMIRRGSDNIAFSSIVAFGENTAKPHAHASSRKLKKGDAVTLDFGAKYNGYCSDMTRSFLYGKGDGEYEKIYNILLDSQKYALDNLQAGITGKEGDALSRNYLKRFELDGYFTHSLGHSLGVDIHESPNLSPRCNAIIEENYILSVEPGLYFSGYFGIRIEDIVIFKKSGVENLTKSQKNFIIV